jgi:hypothetical protein
MKRLSVPLALVALAVNVASADAGTYQGTISPPVVTADGRGVTADITVTKSCSPSEYCGFYPIVTTVADPQPCTPVITGSSWVGTLASSPFMAPQPPSVSSSESAFWSEFPTLYSGVKRACLYARTDNVLVAETTYVVPAPPAPTPFPTPVPYPTATPYPAGTPAYVPAPTAAPEPQSLSQNEAKHATRGWMKRKFGRRWSRGTHKIVRCPVRTSSAQLGCYAVWIYRSRVYSRSIVITETETTYLISKSFRSAPAQTPPPATGSDPGPSSADFCDTHVCIPNYDNGSGSTVRCRDGSYSHSGGKQGACSHHGGVASSASLSRRSSLALSSAGPTLTDARRSAVLTARSRIDSQGVPLRRPHER